MITRHPLARGALAMLAVTAVAVPTAATALPNTAPAGAKAGQGSGRPDAGILAAHLLDQEIAWEDCVFGSPREYLNDLENVSCADITVPRDWKNPTDGKTITVRINVTDTAGADRQGIILVNPGGPGSSALWLGPEMTLRSPTLAEEFDFVGMDPRGVGESTPLECFYYQDNPSDRTADAKLRAETCQRLELAPYINTEQTTYDMDFIRALLGEEKLNYLGYSYGTWLGKWYEVNFAHHAGRFVLDSAADVSDKSLEPTWDKQPQSRDRQFQERFLPYIARNAEHFGSPTDDPLELRELWELGGGARTLFGGFYFGRRVLPAMYNNKNYEEGAFVAMDIIDWGLEARAEGKLSAGLENLSVEETRELIVQTNAELESRYTGAQRRAEQLLNQNLLAEFDALAASGTLDTESLEPSPYPTQVRDVDFDAIRCQDGPWNHSQGYWDAWVANIQKKAALTAPFVTSFPLCRWWPNNTEMPKAHVGSFPDTLILQSEMDVATPYEVGLKAAQALPNTALISIDDEGTHGLFPYGTECVDKTVEAYFIDGTMPEKKFNACAARPLPLETKVFPVGEVIGPNNKAKNKMVTPLVRQANEIAQRVLEQDQAARDLPLQP